MDRPLATLSFFTRLPFWRLKKIDPDAYTRVVELWPLAGWLTGGLMCVVFLLAVTVFSPLTAAVLAFASRLLLTGALHEDGLADFCDGMGGGSDRERILAIMKDSHIGSYGVIGLIIYFLAAVSAVGSMPTVIAPVALLVSDCWSKATAAMIINSLPYARTAATAKNHLVYNRMTPIASVICLFLGALPLLLIPTIFLWAALAPIVATAGLILYMRGKIGGYTGDCCGAVFLISELTMLLTIAAISRVEWLLPSSFLLGGL